MPGQTVVLFNKRSVDYSGGDGSLTINRTVDASRWTSAEVLVRVHSNSISSGSGKIEVKAYSVLLSAEDPSTDFVDGTALATCTVDVGNSAGDLERDDTTTPFGAALQIKIEGTKGTSSTVTAEMSAEVVFKD